MRINEGGVDELSQTQKIAQLASSWRCLPVSILPRVQFPTRHLLVSHVEAVGAAPLALAWGLVGGLLRSFTRSTESDAAALFNQRAAPDWIPVLRVAVAIAASAPHLALGAMTEAVGHDLTTRLGATPPFGTCSRFLFLIPFRLVPDRMHVMNLCFLRIRKSWSQEVRAVTCLLGG